MEPALRPGDWLLARRTARVRPGQVVLAWHPERPGFLLVKRVAWREPGGWWLASDNPVAGAVDSARFGPVPAEKIVARVLLRYWPRGDAPDGKRRHRHGARTPAPPGGPTPRPPGVRRRAPHGPRWRFPSHTERGACFARQPSAEPRPRCAGSGARRCQAIAVSSR